MNCPYSREDRLERLARARSLVVKVGSAVLTTPEGLNMPVLRNLAEQLSAFAHEGRRVTLVSSGAVAAGRAALSAGEHRVEGLPGKQGAAAVGQGRLMREYEDAFAAHGLVCAQVLLTRDDLRSRERFMNARHTFTQLLDWGVIPVVNENDTVAVQELRFGDNDALASLLLNPVEGDLFVNLTSTGGVLAENPLTSPDPASIPLLESIDDIRALDLDALCGGKTGVKRGLLHHRGGHDAARERRDAGDDERAVHEERTDEPAQAHEPGEARNTDDHGLPLLEQALETEERAHVGDEEEDGDGGAQRQKLRVRNERLWEEGPEGDEDQHGGDEDRRNPAFRELGEHLAQQDDDEAGRKGRDKVVHEHGLVP